MFEHRAYHSRGAYPVFEHKALPSVGLYRQWGGEVKEEEET